MTGVARQLAEYVAEHQAGGEADPLVFLDRLGSEEERVLLASEIDRYLVAAPRREFDAERFTDSTAAQTVDALERALAGQAGLWPAVLPRLRARAGIKRSALVERLANALDVADRSEKVGAYYHAMEQGLLDSRGVSDKVLSALAAIVGETTESLHDSGRSLLPPRSGTVTTPAAFARHAAWPVDIDDAGVTGSRDAEAWDEVDELFRGEPASDAENPSDSSGNA
jgi:hypothetical protein